jgi:hypothetical protein
MDSPKLVSFWRDGAYEGASTDSTALRSSAIRVWVSISCAVMTVTAPGIFSMALLPERGFGDALGGRRQGGTKGGEGQGKRMQAGRLQRAGHRGAGEIVSEVRILIQDENHYHL